jgi:hypothetical protein
VTLDTKRACRIKYQDSDFNIFSEETWESTIQSITEAMVNLERAIKPHLSFINKKVKEL